MFKNAKLAHEQKTRGCHDVHLLAWHGQGVGVASLVQMLVLGRLVCLGFVLNDEGEVALTVLDLTIHRDRSKKRPHGLD